MEFNKMLDYINHTINFDWVLIGDYCLKLFMTIVWTYVIIFLIRVSIRQIFKKAKFMEEKKKQTIESAIANTSNYVAFFIILITAIHPFVDLKQLLVAGGVIGIVIGFGAQSLIKDILTGFFLLFEQQFQKGDFVHINENVEGGTIEEVGFRVVKIRMMTGKLVTLPNGEIRKVVNGNVHKRRIYESVVVSFREEPMKIKKLLEEVCEDLNARQEEYLKTEKDGEFTEKYYVHGMSSLDTSALGYRFSIAATVRDTDYIVAVQEAKEALAQRLFEDNIKMPEQHVYYKTRA